MGQGQIKKGFFFYFGLLALLLIAVFMICLVILMFNPGKTVLWMQYFTGNETHLITKTTDNTLIDLANVTNLEINCSYANVTVQKSKEYTTSGIRIINQAKGFAAASNAVEFDYNVYFEGPVLKIDLTEPNGFIYLSKRVEIVLHAYSESSLNFQNMKLTVNTTGGQVDIGGTAMNAAQNVKLSTLNVNTGKGNIYLSSMFDTSTLTELSLNTAEGGMYSTKDIAYGGTKTGKGFSLNCNASLKTTKGLISFGVVNVSTHNVSIRCKKGNVAIDYINAGTVSVQCVQGNYKFGEIYGNLDFTNSEDSILAPNILADYISGNFSISTQTVTAEPNININKVGGEVSVIADKGKLDIDEACGTVDITSAKTLAVDIKISENNSSTKRIINSSGDVKLGFLGNVAGTTIVETNSGKVFVYITSVASFTANAFVNDLLGITKLADNKISVTLGMADGETKNPLVVRGTSGTTGTINIKTNATVSYNLVSKESLVAKEVG